VNILRYDGRWRRLRPGTDPAAKSSSGG